MFLLQPAFPFINIIFARFLHNDTGSHSSVLFITAQYFVQSIGHNSVIYSTINRDYNQQYCKYILVQVSLCIYARVLGYISMGRISGSHGMCIFKLTRYFQLFSIMDIILLYQLVKNSAVSGYNIKNNQALQESGIICQER